MDSPSPKRRKMSPSTTLDPDASNPLIRHPIRDRQSLTPSRASYLSPTKASLARFNPHLLPLSTQTATKRPSSRGSQGPDTTWSIATNGALDPADGIDRAARPVTPFRGTTPARTEANGRADEGGSPMRNVQSIEGGFSATPIRRSRPGQYVLPPKRALYDPRASLPAAMEIDSTPGVANQVSEQEQTPKLAEGSKKVSGKEVPGLGPGEEEDFESPTIPRPLENGTGPGTDYDDDGEPRLPSTPTQLGLEPPPEPPKGILLSSPSRRPKRKTRSSMKPSPLKPRISATEEVVVDSQERSSLGPRRYYSSLQEATNDQNAPTNPNKHPKPDFLTQSLILFLPFSKGPPPPVPRPPTPPLLILDTLPNPNATTPLPITATEDNLRTPPSDNLNLRHKQITFTSPQNLLIVKLHVTVNLTTKEPTEITLSSISSWAARELEIWLRKAVVARDLTSIRDAINEYWRLAEIRAKCWIKCEEEFGPLLSESTVLDLPDTTKTDNRPNGRRKPLSPRSSFDAQDPRRQTLNYYLHRTSLLLTLAPVSLLISWRLAFNENGKLESHISACAAFPDSWVNAEEGKELERVSEAFDGLLRSGVGVFQAVEVVCGVIFPDDD